MDFMVKQGPISQNRVRELVVGPFEHRFRGPRSIGGLWVDVPIASTIRGEYDSRAVTAPQRKKIAGVPRRQRATSTALQIMNPKIESVPDDCLRPVRRKTHLPIHILILAHRFA